MSTEDEQNSKRQNKGNNSPAKLHIPPGTKEEKSSGRIRNSKIQRLKKRDFFKGILVFIWRKDNQARFQNIISVIAIAVALWLAIVTYQVYKLAAGQATSVVNSANAAVKSADIAESTFISDTLYNFKTLTNQQKASQKSDTSDSIRLKQEKDLYDLQQKTYKSNNSDMKARFKIDTMALHLQIQVLEESKKQFKEQNEPILEIAIDTIYEVDSNWIRIEYTMSNVGNTAAILRHATCNIQSGDILGDIIWGKPNDIFGDSNYITKEYSKKKMITTMLSKIEVDAIINGDIGFFWIGTYEYNNVITDEKRQYLFCVYVKRNGNAKPIQEFRDERNEAKK